MLINVKIHSITDRFRVASKRGFIFLTSSSPCSFSSYSSSLFSCFFFGMSLLQGLKPPCNMSDHPAVHAFKFTAICHPPVCAQSTSRGRTWKSFGDKRSRAKDAGGPHRLIVRMTATRAAHLEQHYMVHVHG